MDETNKEFLMRRNLTDAGFPESEIANIISLLEEGRENAVHRILAQQRTVLLNTVHENQKRIDCLDYLVYDMNNTPKPGRPAKGKLNMKNFTFINKKVIFSTSKCIFFISSISKREITIIIIISSFTFITNT